jgi:trans-aconitate methyltransferase
MNRLSSQWQNRAFSQTVASFTRVHLLRTGVQLGLFESLRQPKTANQLVQDSQLAPDLLQAWLRAAEAQGLVRMIREQDCAYQVDGLARWLLESPQSKSLIAVLDQMVEDYGPLFERIPDLLRGAARPDFGSREAARRAAEASRLVERQALEALTRIPGVRGAKRVLDIGCGYGTYLTGLLLRHRDAHGLGIEQDADVAEIAVRNLEEADLVRRSEVRVGEFMALDLDAGSFDLILLNNNLYYFAPNTWSALFERIFSRLVPRGLLAIQVPVVSDRAASRILGHTANAAAFDLYLRAHNNLYGFPDLAQLHAALRETGFETVAETVFLPGGAARYLWAKAPAEAD